jgi:uncharacterized protein YegL
MLVLITVLLAVFFLTVIFSVDVAYMQLVNTQLRCATDAAAKAAVDRLSQLESVTEARQAAKDTAAANLVAGRTLILEDDDIEFGRADMSLANGRILFMPGEEPLSAVRTRGRKFATAPSGSARLFFGGLLGHPRYETMLTATASRRDRDICLVVDRSGSMAGTKLQDLKDAVSIFLSALGETAQDEIVGLASYSTNATRNNSLVSDLPLIDASMQQLTANGYTNIGGGIDVGRDILSEGRNSSFVEKTMIVMTDGLHNTGTDPIEAAERAQADGIVIHAITFGADADTERMTEVAHITGGTYNHAPDGEELKRIYREIALTLATQLSD